MKEDNWLCFKQGLNCININDTDINSQWSQLLDDIKNVVEFSFPLKSSSKKYIFTMSQGLLKSRDKKNKLLRQYKAGKIDKQIYIAYNRVYRKLIKNEQSKKFRFDMKEAGNSGKQKWKVIKKGLLLESEKGDIDEVCDKGNFLRLDEDIAKAFKTHFETCATKLTEGLPRGADTSVAAPLGNSWHFNHTNEQEIVKLIKTLKNKNSSGYDNLTNKMLKREPHLFARLIVPLLNKSLDEGFFQIV